MNSGNAGLRASVLREIGLAPLWKLRTLVPILTRASTSTPTSASIMPAVASDACGDVEVIEAIEANIPNVSATAAAITGDRGDSSLVSSEMSAISTPPTRSVTENQEEHRAAAIAAMDWQQLRDSVAECRACDLCRDRAQTVFGVGDEAADWLFVGEGPGAEEDACGEPFVGAAGKLLDAMLAAIDLERGQGVYIANAVKCRASGEDRPPSSEEMAACRPYLERQVELLRPKLIVALGRPAAQTLLQTEVKISTARTRLFSHALAPVVVTYHPAYLLRTPMDKAKAWEDLCLARRTIHDTRRMMRGDS